MRYRRILRYAEIPDAAIKTCLGLMEQRGPDAGGVRRFASGTGRAASPLHTRLSIIDLDPRANQPFQHRQAMAHFQWRALQLRRAARASLSARRRSCDDSDTEVLLQRCDRDGLDGLDRCEGMWAFALFDEADGQPDVMPRSLRRETALHSPRLADGLYFGSEVKFLFALMGRRCRSIGSI